MAVIRISALVLAAFVIAAAVEESGSGSVGAQVPGNQGGSAGNQDPGNQGGTQGAQGGPLSGLSGNSGDPKEVLERAFDSAIIQIKKAGDESQVIKEAEKDPRTSKALENCEQLLDYSIDDLKASLKKLTNGEFSMTKVDKFIYDIKIWLSGSLTYQDTCLEGFEGTQGEASEKMKAVLKTAGDVTRNAITLVNQGSAMLTKLNMTFLNQRTLSETDPMEEHPDWVSDKMRKLLDLTVDNITPNLVVAKDGSGQFKTISEAVASVPIQKNEPFVIRIKEGIYNEVVVLGLHKWNVVMIGDGPDKTIITSNNNFADGIPTYNTSTFAVVGKNFMAKNIGFENSAGPDKRQAVALRVESDKSIFFNCRMAGYESTLYAHTHRQFYSGCTISGTVNFVFGNAAAVFQNCQIMVRKPLETQKNVITAQGRNDNLEPTGIVIQNCTIGGEPDYLPVKERIPTFLGQPPKMYSRAIVMQSQIEDIINPEGWLAGQPTSNLETCFFVEYDNRGPGASTSRRVKATGVKTIDKAIAEEFTAQNFIHPDDWLKPSAVPFTSGLLPAGAAA